MNILVLYALAEKNPRKTILDSLYCFSNCDKKNRYYYLDILDIASVKKVAEYSSSWLQAIIVHYSAISQRYAQVWWKTNKDILIALMKRYDCPKIIIPQDEYNYNGDVREFIKQAGVKYIYTCAYEEDFEKLYPKELNYEHIETVFTGYIDEDTLKEIQKMGYNKKREIDIRYRARKLPYWLGKHGQLKYELAEVFLEYLKDQDEIKYDIANTGPTNQNVLFGDSWIEYLLSCRTMLGCLGGSGLLDVDGSIARSVDLYVNEHPDASFEEVEEKCFKGKDNTIHLFALSPRHFECAMTKTCQVLVEGNYGGVFEPGVDYIELKKDFSNIEEVVKKIKDVDYCKNIAENCYNHVVMSGKYTYTKFTEHIINNIEGKNERGFFHIRLWLTCQISKKRSIVGCIELAIVKRIGAVKNYMVQFLMWLLGKIFKIFEIFRYTKWHQFLKRKWNIFLQKYNKK